MNTHYLDKLEFNKVLENLSKYCSTDLGKELAMQLTIYHDANIVKQKLSLLFLKSIIIYKLFLILFEPDYD